MLHFQDLSRWGGVGGALKVACYKFEEQHPMLLHFTSQETFLALRSCSVDEACKKKKNVLYTYLIGLLTNILEQYNKSIRIKP